MRPSKPGALVYLWLNEGLRDEIPRPTPAVNLSKRRDDNLYTVIPLQPIAQIPLRRDFHVEFEPTIPFPVKVGRGPWIARPELLLTIHQKRLNSICDKSPDGRIIRYKEVATTEQLRSIQVGIRLYFGDLLPPWVSGIM